MIGRIKNGIRSFLKPDKHPEITRIKTAGLTYLSNNALLGLKNCVLDIETRKVPGIFIETGCALGGSSIVIGLNKSLARPLYIYDVFAMIPPPSSQDGNDVIDRYDTIISGKSTGLNNNKYYGYEENLKEKVISNLSSFGLEPSGHNIHLVEGLYENTLKIDQPVAFAHIDCDWYESVKLCLHQIVPHLSPGGKIIIDDYYDWSGCRKATDEYFSGKDGYILETISDKLHIYRT